ncbi:hypothetical protein LCGC14_1986550 [marine sediment metagenome]|uniref:Uncharacterized protein n=1 Tax=marine sediment metagenome TaxID=412755 RepID=A0A0F9F7B2_9ZZZZ
MKLVDLTEAKYYRSIYVDWINQQINNPDINKQKCLGDDDIFLSRDALEVALKDISKEFGEPEIEEEADEYITYTWETKTVYIELFTYGTLGENRRVGICVEKPYVTEARYASRPTVFDVLEQYRKLSGALAYNRDSTFARDAAARSMLINDRTAAEIAIVVNGRNFDVEQAIEYTRKMLQSKGLPYTTIDADQRPVDIYVQVRYQD